MADQRFGRHDWCEALCCGFRDGVGTCPECKLNLCASPECQAYHNKECFELARCSYCQETGWHIPFCGECFSSVCDKFFCNDAHDLECRR